MIKPNCTKCKRPIFEPNFVGFGENQFYHAHCFSCSACKKKLDPQQSDKVAIDDKGAPLCENCSVIECGFCKKEIDGEAVLIDNVHFHTECFNCDTCGTTLVNMPYVPLKNQRVCVDCYNGKPKIQTKAILPKDDSLSSETNNPFLSANVADEPKINTLASSQTSGSIKSKASSTRELKSMSDDGANVIKPEPTIQQVQAAIQTTASIKSKVSSTRDLKSVSDDNAVLQNVTKPEQSIQQLQTAFQTLGNTKSKVSSTRDLKSVSDDNAILQNVTKPDPTILQLQAALQSQKEKTENSNSKILELSDLLGSLKQELMSLKENQMTAAKNNTPAPAPAQAPAPIPETTLPSKPDSTAEHVEKVQSLLTEEEAVKERLVILRNEVRALEEQRDGLKTTITTMESEIANHKSEVEKMTEQKELLKKKIAYGTSEYEKLKKNYSAMLKEKAAAEAVAPASIPLMPAHDPVSEEKRRADEEAERIAHEAHEQLQRKFRELEANVQGLERAKKQLLVEIEAAGSSRAATITLNSPKTPKTPTGSNGNLFEKQGSSSSALPSPQPASRPKTPETKRSVISKLTKGFRGKDNGSSSSNSSANNAKSITASIPLWNDIYSLVEMEKDFNRCAYPIPIIVQDCIAAVESYGMAFEGIYRKSGPASQINRIVSAYQRGEYPDLSDNNEFNDITAITSSMKKYFMELVNPLLMFELAEWWNAAARAIDDQDKLIQISQLVFSLPRVNRFTLGFLMLHLERVQRYSSINKMTPTNLGVVWGPTLLKSQQTDIQSMVADSVWKNGLVEFMVLHAKELFDLESLTAPSRHPYANLDGRFDGYNENY